MHLSAGDKLGPYEITELIGKGGMGEVYRATDTRRFLMTVSPGQGSSAPITVVLNWQADLTR